MFNFFKFSRTIKKLTAKVVGADDTLLVVTKQGAAKKVLASDFNPIFAHVSFDASGGNSYSGDTIAAHNVSSVVRSETGVYKITFTTPHSSGKYTAVTTAGKGNYTSSARSVSIDEYSDTSITLRVERTDTGSQQDEAYISVMILH